MLRKDAQAMAQVKFCGPIEDIKIPPPKYIFERKTEFKRKLHSREIKNGKFVPGRNSE
jgi:hypothetical protein